MTDTELAKTTRYSREWFAARITRKYQKAAELLLEQCRAIGQDLADAKQRLPFGDYTAMVEEDLPFSVRTAQRFMAIAKYPMFEHKKYANALPPAWSTLYELTRLPEATFRSGVQRKQIHPDMERQDVARLLRPKARRSKKHVNVDDRMNKIEDTLTQLVQEAMTCADKISATRRMRERAKKMATWLTEAQRHLDKQYREMLYAEQEDVQDGEDG